MRAILTFRRRAFNFFRNLPDVVVGRGGSGARGTRGCSGCSGIMKYLNVAEKNDAAKTIAGHLSGGTSRRREGLSPYNKIYEFDASVNGRPSKMVMTSVSGHLLGYEFVGAYKTWQSCDPATLFEAPVAKMCPQDSQKIKATLEREVRGCAGLIVWTDCDREGENIGFEIIQTCRAIVGNLRVYRAKFSEITAASVRRALLTLGEPDRRVSDAVDVRQELDLRIGAAFTRFQTLKLQRVFPRQLGNSLVSYGSCQFPTLGFVVERYRAVESFIPEPFWKIAVAHQFQGLKVEFLWKRSRLFDHSACAVILDVCNERPTATVENVKSKPKSKWRPLPLDTIEMEKLGSRKLHINAKQVMQIAEKLYTKGIISYPRTETNIYPKELNLSNLIGLHGDDPRWGPFARQILDSGGPDPRQGKKSDQAHPPIHPTKNVTDLQGDEKKVYELVVRSFLACCSKDAQGHETTVEIDIAGEKFSASGLMIIARNYLEVYPYDKWTAKEIPVYQEGQTFLPTTMEIVQGQTSAPSLLTEADLIALMERHGIGTDATHADHIETIKSREYVGLADNIHFVPGHLGMGLVEGYDSMGLSFSKPTLRATLESDLKAICDGLKSPQTVLSEQIAAYRDVYITVAREAEKIYQALGQRLNQTPSAPSEIESSFQPTVMKCDKCKSNMTLRNKKDDQGYYIGCMGYPQCKNAIWLPSVINTVRVTDQVCGMCGPHSKKLEFTWKSDSLKQRFPQPYISCIGGCDYDFMRTLKINVSTGNHMTNITENSSHPSSVTTNNITTSATINNGQSSTQTNGWAANTARTNYVPSSNTQTGGWTSNAARTNYVPSSNTQTNGWITNGTQTNNNQSRFSSPATDDNHVVCNCGEPAILLTVRKASPNIGRKFYKCSKPKENGGCDFFLWAEEVNDDNSNQNQQQTYSRKPPGSGNNYTSHTSSENTPNCQCNLPAKSITVMKDGPNKGRPFYCCPNPISNRCNFFEWADSGSDGSNPSTSWGSSGSSNNANRRQPKNPSTTVRAKKRCGNCREEGHTRNKCPRLQ